MKKGQILAALALAFALGVVAPVANVMNASAIDHTAQSATCDEVKHVREVVEGNATYKAMIKLRDDAAKYTGTDNEAAVKSAITVAMSALQTASVAVSSIPGSSASLTDTKNAAIMNVANYSIYDTLHDAIDNPVADTLQNFKNGVRDYNGITGVTPVIADYSWVDWAAVAADTAVVTGGTYTAPAAGTPASITGTWSFQNWTLYNNLINAVDAATEFTTGMSTLEADLLALGVSQDDIDATTTPAARAALANTKVAGYAAYTNTTDGVAQEVADSLACSAANEATSAYGYINAIAVALKKADSATYGSKTANEVADILLGTSAPVVTPNPEEPGTDTPTTPDDGKGEDNTDKVGTPNDGALAKAEGSTSASASIMAAIATALTAAGAAFIAIRRKIAAKKEA